MASKATKETCICCNGTGTSSNGFSCYPCSGTGRVIERSFFFAKTPTVGGRFASSKKALGGPRNASAGKTARKPVRKVRARPAQS